MWRTEKGDWLPQLRQNPLFWGGFRCSWCDNREDRTLLLDIKPGDGFCYQGDCRSFPELRRWVDEPAMHDTTIGGGGSIPTDNEPRHEDESHRPITATELDVLFDEEKGGDLCEEKHNAPRRAFREGIAQNLAKNRPVPYSVRSNLIRDEQEEQKRLDDEGRDPVLELAAAHYYEQQQQREEEERRQREEEERRQREEEERRQREEKQQPQEEKLEREEKQQPAQPNNDYIQMFFPQRGDAEEFVFVAPQQQQQQHFDLSFNDMFNRYRSARADRTRRRLNYQDAQTVNQFGAAMRDPVPQLVQDLYLKEENDHAKLISAAFRTNIPVETLVTMWNIYDHLILHQIYTAIFEGHQHNQQERMILEFLILEKRVPTF